MYHEDFPQATESHNMTDDPEWAIRNKNEPHWPTKN